MIIRVEGDVDLYSSPQIRKVILERIKKKQKKMLIDLQGVSYMDSSGVATLVEALQRMKEYNGQLGICSIQGSVRDVFELSRLDRVFDIFEDEEQARKACHVDD
jgi:anti-sigma B factor antagonist